MLPEAEFLFSLQVVSEQPEKVLIHSHFYCWCSSFCYSSLPSGHVWEHGNTWHHPCLYQGLAPRSPAVLSEEPKPAKLKSMPAFSLLFRKRMPLESQRCAEILPAEAVYLTLGWLRVAFRKLRLVGSLAFSSRVCSKFSPLLCDNLIINYHKKPNPNRKQHFPFLSCLNPNLLLFLSSQFGEFLLFPADCFLSLPSTFFIAFHSFSVPMTLNAVVPPDLRTSSSA